MAGKKSVKGASAGRAEKGVPAAPKRAAKPAAKASAKPAAKAIPAPLTKATPKPAAGNGLAKEARPARAAGPSARSCPLVLDGEVAVADFSPADCLTCGEFDCRFCEAEAGSGSLRSRLFAGGDSDDDEGSESSDEGWGLDFGDGGEVGDGEADGDELD